MNKKQKGLLHSKTDLEIAKKKGHEEGRAEAYDEIITFTLVVSLWILTQHNDFTQEEAEMFFRRYLAYAEDVKDGKTFDKFREEVYSKTGIMIKRKDEK